jgi:hypothetical protein
MKSARRRGSVPNMAVSAWDKKEPPDSGRSCARSRQLSKEVLPRRRHAWRGSFCEGFRMTAPSGIYPRAPWPSSESLQGRNPREVGRNVPQAIYGDFDAAAENAAADDVVGGAIAQPRGAGDEARLGRQQKCAADLGFAGCMLVRAVPRPALGQRDGSVQQRRTRFPELMRCRS